MRKRELVHLHALGDALRREIEPPPAATAVYDELDVTPTGIHRRKATHRRAVQELFDAVGHACRRRTDANESVSGAGRRS